MKNVLICAVLALTACGPSPSYVPASHSAPLIEVYPFGHAQYARAQGWHLVPVKGQGVRYDANGQAHAVR